MCRLRIDYRVDYVSSVQCAVWVDQGLTHVGLPMVVCVDCLLPADKP